MNRIFLKISTYGYDHHVCVGDGWLEYRRRVGSEKDCVGQLLEQGTGIWQAMFGRDKGSIHRALDIVNIKFVLMTLLLLKTSNLGCPSFPSLPLKS